MINQLIKEIMLNFNDNPLIDDVKKCKTFEIDKQMTKYGCLPILFQCPSINKYQFTFSQFDDISYDFITRNSNDKLNLISENDMFKIEREFFGSPSGSRKSIGEYTLSFKKINGKLKVKLSKFYIVKRNVPIAFWRSHKLSDFEIDITNNPKEMADSIYNKIINALKLLASINLLLSHSGRIVNKSLKREVEQDFVVI